MCWRKDKQKARRVDTKGLAREDTNPAITGDTFFLNNDGRTDTTKDTRSTRAVTMIFIFRPGGK